MKTKLLSFLMLLTLTINYAQTTASAAGIAIQGIARDNNNTARVSATLSLTFRIYYGSNVQIYEDTKTVTTDAFGVFSIVLEPGDNNNIVIANTQAFLKISEGSTIISDEKLKQVPYAIAASNGVPTGSIMPFIGTTAPVGWILCNGSALPLDASAAALKILLGTDNAPNLQGMFLRGTGISPVNSQAGPGLKATQGDDIKSHNHEKGGLITTGGDHSHKYRSGHGNDAGIKSADQYAGEIGRFSTENTTEGSGAHTHPIAGYTANTGGSETRPVNYGVNYIIKL
ncbi:Microcystin-dependent protein [Flavobacterium segetis]|uniref:Microcystin-dependent protein n=1 Tax=Flavobacterium segetis TaxID=271157 RepID=A0A1M5JSE8_9FLAO|nr:tail fiber protein [Flavobacterium segetis]SHG43199.1 Microcystin-dependent protein [Flavobacterium segetis]